MAFGKDDVFKKIKRLVTYCGDYLKCLNIKKGDSYDTVFKKMDDVVCDLFRRMDALDSPNIISNPSCPNGGFVLLDGNGDVAFADCYPDKTDVEFIDSLTCKGFDVFIDGQKVYTYCEDEFILSFQNNETCDNGGFDVLDFESNIIFSQCYPDNYTEAEIMTIVKDNISSILDNQTIFVSSQGKLYAALGLPLVLTINNTTSGKNIVVSKQDRIEGVGSAYIDMSGGTLDNDIEIGSSGKIKFYTGIVRKVFGMPPGGTPHVPAVNDHIILMDTGNILSLTSTISGEEFIVYNQSSVPTEVRSLPGAGIIDGGNPPDQSIFLPAGGIVKLIKIGTSWVIIHKNY